MSNARYKPRLKRGILNSKQFTLVGKDLKKLKKQKWNSFLRSSVDASFLEPFIRNDVHLIQTRTVDLRKEYARALSYKRQVSAFFNTVKKSSLRTSFFKSSKNLGNSSFLDFFIDSLELRLDTLLLRSNLAKTLHQARWLISSGFVSVNKKVTKINSSRIEVGDFIEIKKVNFQKSSFFSLRTFNLPPEYLEVNFETLSLILVDKPSRKAQKETLKLYPFFLGVQDIINFNKVN